MILPNGDCPARQSLHTERSKKWHLANDGDVSALAAPPANDFVFQNTLSY